VTPNHPNYVQIGDVPLRTFGWKATDWGTLYGIGDLRGEDDEVPGLEAEVHNDRKVHGSLLAAIAIDVHGRRDSDGAPHADRWDGLHTNLAELAGLYVPGLQEVTIYHGWEPFAEGELEVRGGWSPVIEPPAFARLVLNVKVVEASRLSPA
jgi:hypothetical protein